MLLSRGHAGGGGLPVLETPFECTELFVIGSERKTQTLEDAVRTAAPVDTRAGSAPLDGVDKRTPIENR
jgi:hypothetical protein